MVWDIKVVKRDTNLVKLGHKVCQGEVHCHCMGEKVEPWRDFIQKHALEAKRRCRPCRRWCGT